MPEESTSPPGGPGQLCRRRILQATAGLGIASITTLPGTVTAQQDAETIWTYASGEERLSPWRIEDGQILASGSGTVYRLSVSDGTVAWTFETGIDGFDSVVTTAGQLAYVTAGETVYGINRDDGTEAWAFDTGADFPSYPRATNELVLTTASGSVFAIDATDGTEQWQFEPPSDGVERVSLRATTLDDTFLASTPTSVYGLTPETGAINWTFTPDGTFDRLSATFPRDGQTGVRAGGTMYGVDITDGTKLWSFDTAYDSIRWASSSRDSIQLLENGVAISVDSTDGSEQWRFELPDAEIDGNNIFRTVNSLGVAYLTSPNAVYGLDAATGAVEWEFETTAESSMAVDVTFDSTWMYISDAGTTFRVDPATGESDWSFDISAEESELTVADSNGEDIYLIETGGDLRRIAPSGGSGGTGNPDGSTHPSGVSDNVFEAVDSDGDGDLSRVEVRDTVEGFIRDGEVDGVSVGRSDVRMLVEYFVKQ